MTPRPKPVRERDAGRQVPEWVADHPDQAIPKRVKDRIWLREGGRCYLSGDKIKVGDAFEFEHVIALTNGGENRESNIRLALKEPHKTKTAADRKTSTKTRRMRMKNNGTWPKSKRPLKGRTFESTREQRNG